MAELKQYACIRFTRKSGDIDTTLEGIGRGMLQLWALQNTPKSKDSIVFDKETGEVISYYAGTGGVPRVAMSKYDELGNIEDYCPGILTLFCGEM